ncbi:hypothetical protein EP56_01925 [Listeriaceae bacterium FSL A5-0209]|nr:hypothetical protein EP56_01925 [Listeriaceae bacterium FSL A5-0209]
MVKMTTIQEVEMMMKNNNFVYATDTDKRAIEIYLITEAIYANAEDAKNDVLFLTNKKGCMVTYLEKGVKKMDRSDEIAGSRYTLGEIRAKFTECSALEEPKRTNELVKLMNILEQEYGTHQLYPSKEFLEKEEVQLYREISMARN